MKADEKALLLAIQRETSKHPPLPCPRDVAEALGMNAKRAAYLFEKWDKKGWYNYGVSLTTGWLTEKGMGVEE